jgi:hypothetical protein
MNKQLLLLLKVGLEQEKKFEFVLLQVDLEQVI